MATLASAIIDRAAKTLFDITGIKWNRVELLDWLGMGQRAIVGIDPTASNTTVSMAMVAGVRQTVPADGWMLLDVFANMGVAPGTTPGRSPRIVSRKLLDAFNPNWRSATPAQEVKNILFDQQDQVAFWVYPPSDGTGYLQINYARLPVTPATEATAITLSDAYEGALVDYVLWRACLKEVDYSPGPERAAAFCTSFEKGVAILLAGSLGSDPNQMLNAPKPGGD